ERRHEPGAIGHFLECTAVPERVVVVALHVDLAPPHPIGQLDNTHAAIFIQLSARIDGKTRISADSWRRAGVLRFAWPRRWCSPPARGAGRHAAPAPPPWRDRGAPASSSPSRRPAL